MPQRSKKEQIIEVATGLFHANGFNATGVEKVKDSAKVTKKTLYNHFSSKDELILAVLRREDENIRNSLLQRLEKIEDDPRKRLVGIFDIYIEWIADRNFKGCLFIKATAEYSDPENACNAVSVEAKELVREEIKRLALDLGVSDPDTLAANLDLLIQGAMVRAQVAGDKSAILLAKDIAVDLIAKAMKS